MNLSNLLNKCTIIDLTHSLNAKVPTWDGKQGFDLKKDDKIEVYTSTGTHIDAPSYYNKKGYTIDTLPLQQLVAPAHVIDLSNMATGKTAISPEDIERYEAQQGPIGPNSLVIAYTGWSRHWPNTNAYRNNLHFPTWSVPAIELLLEKKIAGVAIDTLALESLASSFPGHKLLMKANKYIIENIAHCDRLPPKGAIVIALPLKIERGTEAPARVIGLVPH